MGSVKASKVLLTILNVIYTILGLGIAATSIWFFVQLQEFTSLRNSNHYLLDYNVYWPQAVPWIFFFSGVLVLCVSCCGFTSASKNSRGIVFMYSIFNVIVALILIGAAIVVLVCADNQRSDDFIKDTVWDGYSQAKGDKNVLESFGLLERKLHCCGAHEPRDYKSWRNDFPQSCCDTYYHGFYGPQYYDCQFTNQAANERHGCSEVAAQYARIVMKVLSAACVFTAFIGILNLAISVMLSRGLKKKSQVLQHQTSNEFESKKVLLM